MDARPPRDPGVTYRFRKAHHGEGCAACGWRIAPALQSVGGEYGCGLHAHHVVPLAAGGSDEESNLVLLCPNHHELAHQLWAASAAGGQGPTDATALVHALQATDRYMKRCRRAGKSGQPRSKSRLALMAELRAGIVAKRPNSRLARALAFVPPGQ